VLLLALTVLATTAGSLMTRSVVHRNEQRLLEQKAAEGSLVLSSLMSQSYGTATRALAAALTPTGVNQALFGQIAGALQAPSTGANPGLGLGGIAVVDLTHRAVLLRARDVLADLASPSVLAAIRKAVQGKGLVGAPPDLGFVQLAAQGSKKAMGMAIALAGGVVGYVEMPITGMVQESDLGPGKPFSGLDFAVYVGDPSAKSLLWSNKPGGALGSHTASSHADLNLNATYAGQTGSASEGPLTIVLSSRHPLVGGFATAFPWLMLISGLLVGLVMMALTEATQRRRDEAVSMVGALQARNAEVERAVQGQTEAEERLRQAQRLEAVGQLAGGIAHDFNNLLAVIITYAGFVRDAVVDTPTADDVHEIDKAAHRAAELTQQLLMFSRRDAVRPSVVDARALVADRERLLRRTLSEDIELVVDLPDHPVHVRADAVELDQVVMNLVVNARDAMPLGGKLQVVMTEVTTRDGATDVQLLVADNGSGMAPEVIEHAFEPFFTTKEVGRGTGLGLATVYGIVTRWGGEVRLSSTVGRGTLVTVQLPTCEGLACDEELAVPAQRRPRGGRVLLVEDEDGVRRATERILVEAGFDVVVATNGQEAMDLFADQEVDVIVTDVVMPGGMSGPDLAEHARLQRPDLPVVLTSGHSRDHLSRRGPLPPGTHLVTKPYTASQLVDVVHASLDTFRKASA
jgi:signal transduction histidine kinase/CheY-like chemotaxis protein